MRLLRLFLAFGALWSYGAFVGASTARCDITYPDPLDIATAYGLTPHRSAASLEPVDLIDPCPLFSGVPRIKRDFYFSVSPMWPDADEINFAEQCYQTACRLFIRSEGKSQNLIEGALKYARMGQYYGHSRASYMMIHYFEYKQLYIPARPDGDKIITFPGEPDKKLALIARRSSPSIDVFGHNKERLCKGEPLCIKPLSGVIARVFADIYKEEQRTRDRVAAKASAELSESKDDAADGKDDAESAPADVDDVVLTDADDAEKEHLLKAETDGTRHRSVAAAASAYTHLM